MAKIQYPTRLDPELLESIREQAKIQNRSVNNMIEVLLGYGLQYVSESPAENRSIVGNNLKAS